MNFLEYANHKEKIYKIIGNSIEYSKAAAILNAGIIIADALNNSITVAGQMISEAIKSNKNNKE